MNTLSKEAAAELMVLLREPRQEARAAGGRAYYEGKPRHDNPHTESSPEYLEWDCGWNVESEENS